MTLAKHDAFNEYTECTGPSTTVLYAVLYEDHQGYTSTHPIRAAVNQRVQNACLPLPDRRRKKVGGVTA